MQITHYPTVSAHRLCCRKEDEGDRRTAVACEDTTRTMSISHALDEQAVLRKGAVFVLEPFIRGFYP